MDRGTAQPLVSILIPHYGGTKIIQECLDSIYNTDYPKIEIIVLNNNSLDDSIKIIQNNYPDVKLIESEYNRGFAGGCNFLSKYANGKFILILNNDTVHEKDWISHLVSRINFNENISSVQPKIKKYDDRDFFDYAGASGGFIDKYCFPFSRGRMFNTIEKDEGQYDDACPIFWASGTAFLTKKYIFEKVGGFDEKLFAHMEEIDYHWKCQMQGYEVWVEPHSIIYHHGGATLPASSSYKTYLNYRNSLILLLTNYPMTTSIKLFFPRFLMEFISLIKEIIFFRWTHAIGILKAWFWIIFHLSFLFNRRKKVKNKSMIDKIYNKSIVIQYFIKGKKTYLEL